MMKKAFLTALSQKFRDNEILFLDKLVLSQPKTKQASEIVKSISQIKDFEKLATKKKNRAIIAMSKKDLEVSRSFRNIPGALVSEVKNLNVLDILTYKYLIVANSKENLSFIK